MQHSYILVLFILLLTKVHSAQSAELALTFNQPEQYTDIREGFSGPQYNYEDIFRIFEKHLGKLASKLPNNYQLVMQVTDIDLAGDIAGGDIRVVTHPFSPRIAFSYQLLDADQVVVVEGKENIRDSAFMTNRSLRYKSDPLGYEKKLFDDWFKERFTTLLAKR